MFKEAAAKAKADALVAPDPPNSVLAVLKSFVSVQAVPFQVSVTA